MQDRSRNAHKHESRNPIQRALIHNFHRNAARLLKLVRPRTILDLGCGEGYALQALTELGVEAELTGIDLSATATESARARLGSLATIEQKDARELADEDRRFDVVMMLEVLEHIPSPEQMLPILERLTDRHLLLSVPHEPVFMGLNFARGKNMSRFGNDPEHVNHWSRRGFREFVERRFDVLEMPKATLPWTMVLAGKRRS